LGGSANAGESRAGQVETTRDLVPHQFQTDPLTELVLEVGNVAEKSLQLKQIVLKMGGAVAEDNARRAAAPPDSAAFFLQIPSERYQEALEQIAALGTLAIPETRAGVRRQETEDARSRQADGGKHRADRIDERDQNAPPENLLRRLMREASRGARADTNERRPDSPVTLRLLLREKPRP
jgi:hypothetical protein